MADAVIGRFKIDNYLLSLPHLHPDYLKQYPKELKGGLLDATVACLSRWTDWEIVRGIHLGEGGYQQRARSYHISAADFNWNLKYIPIVDEIGASLVFADYSFRTLVCSLLTSRQKHVLTFSFCLFNKHTIHTDIAALEALAPPECSPAPIQIARPSPLSLLPISSPSTPLRIHRSPPKSQHTARFARILPFDPIQSSLERFADRGEPSMEAAYRWVRAIRAANRPQNRKSTRENAVPNAETTRRGAKRTRSALLRWGQRVWRCFGWDGERTWREKEPSNGLHRCEPWQWKKADAARS